MIPFSSVYTLILIGWTLVQGQSLGNVSRSQGTGPRSSSSPPVNMMSTTSPRPAAVTTSKSISFPLSATTVSTTSTAPRAGAEVSSSITMSSTSITRILSSSSSSIPDTRLSHSTSAISTTSSTIAARTTTATSTTIPPASVSTAPPRQVTSSTPIRITSTYFLSSIVPASVSIAPPGQVTSSTPIRITSTYFLSTTTSSFSIAPTIVPTSPIVFSSSAGNPLFSTTPSSSSLRASTTLASTMAASDLSSVVPSSSSAALPQATSSTAQPTTASSVYTSIETTFTTDVPSAASTSESIAMTLSTSSLSTSLILSSTSIQVTPAATTSNNPIDSGTSISTQHLPTDTTAIPSFTPSATSASQEEGGPGNGGAGTTANPTVFVSSSPSSTQTLIQSISPPLPSNVNPNTDIIPPQADGTRPDVVNVSPQLILPSVSPASSAEIPISNPNDISFPNSISPVQLPGSSSAVVDNLTPFSGDKRRSDPGASKETSTESGSSNALGGGAIAGIVLAVLAIMVMAAIGLYTNFPKMMDYMNGNNFAAGTKANEKLPPSPILINMEQVDAAVAQPSSTVVLIPTSNLENVTNAVEFADPITGGREPLFSLPPAPPNEMNLDPESPSDNVPLGSQISSTVGGDIQVIPTVYSPLPATTSFVLDPIYTDVNPSYPSNILDSLSNLVPRVPSTSYDAFQGDKGWIFSESQSNVSNTEPDNAAGLGNILLGGAAQVSSVNTSNAIGGRSSDSPPPPPSPRLQAVQSDEDLIDLNESIHSDREHTVIDSFIEDGFIPSRPLVPPPSHPLPIPEPEMQHLGKGSNDSRVVPMAHTRLSMAGAEHDYSPVTVSMISTTLSTASSMYTSIHSEDMVFAAFKQIDAARDTERSES